MSEPKSPAKTGVELPIIQQVEQLVDNVPGWSPMDQLFSLTQLVFTTQHLEGDVLEVGSWCGRSAIALALAEKCLNRNQVHCIDLFPNGEDWYQNDDGDLPPFFGPKLI